MHKHHFPTKKNTKRELKRENKVLIFFKEKEKKTHKTFKVFHFISLYCSFYYPHIMSRGEKKRVGKLKKATRVFMLCLLFGTVEVIIWIIAMYASSPTGSGARKVDLLLLWPFKGLSFTSPQGDEFVVAPKKSKRSTRRNNQLETTPKRWKWEEIAFSSVHRWSSGHFGSFSYTVVLFLYR